ncbi:MAG: hypothetical protein PHY56_04880, partial [Candidatus Omnitrophica bacterium]|nr:hypothetical protein [Candidatus Omnitrophota bacterium]
RRIIEFFGGSNFLLKHNLATPNERPHSFNYIFRKAAQYGFKVEYWESKIFKCYPLVYKLWTMLFPYNPKSGCDLFIILRKEKNV